MKKRYLVKKPRLIRLGSVSRLTKSAKVAFIEEVGRPLS